MCNVSIQTRERTKYLKKKIALINKINLIIIRVSKMDPITISLLIILLTAFLYIVHRAWKANQYWKERGVPHAEGSLFFGNLLPVLLRKMSPGELHEMFCKQFPNEPLFGFYEFMKPTLIVKDSDYIEMIFIKHFANFMDHGIIQIDDEENPTESNLFSTNGKRWKAVRCRLSPIFSTGKLKLMFESMKGCGEELIKQLDKGEKEDVELKDIISCFAMDTIGSCAFGIDSGSLSKPDCEFRQMGKQVFKMDISTFIKLTILMHAPRLAKFLNLTFSKPKILKYFSGIIKDTMKYRRENGYLRNDILQLLMQLQLKGYVEMHSRDAATDDYFDMDITTLCTEKFELSDDQITGHVISFLTGGFDTTAMSILFTLYELSRNPKIQEKVREEILKEVEHAGSMSYNAIKDMHYLERCVKETLRIYPPAQMLGRICTNKYTFPNEITIEPGQSVLIPVMAVHNDPKYFPEPEVFRPERFDPGNTIPACAYLPFGNGPRMCIAMRFAMLEIKYCIATLLRNYIVTLSSKTKQPITLSALSFVTKPKETLYFNIKKIINQ
ncbi:probable cytochrome P450 6d5 [Rhodnius prolixus]|uniref:Cytochrome n=1 Tax=Rhodnius prolixus TaxID=13249 RepID=A0ABL0EJY4_RHOPR